MAQPPDDPPAGGFDEPPDEPPQEYGGRSDEPPEEPPQEYGGRSDEPPDEPPPEHVGRFDEPPEELPEDYGSRYDEPFEEAEDDRPDEPGARHGGSHDEPPESAEPRARFGGRFRRHREEEEPPEEPPDEGLAHADHPTGELFEDDLGEATGVYVAELFDEAPAVPSDDLLGDLGEEVHSSAELAARRAQERAQRKRAGRQRLLVLVAGVVALVVVIVLATGPGGGSPNSNTTSTNPLAAAGTGAGHLAPGSSTAALPANILVADRNNKRLISISPSGRIVWSVSLTGPSDAFLSPTAKSITVTEPSAFVVVQLAASDKRAFYRYGHSGHAGSSDNHLHDPETAQELADGELLIADKSNCRILFVTPPSHHPLLKLGTPGSCVHDPPTTFAYPDSVFPAIGGGTVVTELDPAWVDVLNTANSVVAQIRVPGLSAPDDANEYAAGELIATSHSHPGAVEEFNTAGKVTWSYDPKSGPGELDRPSLAEVLPDGDVLVCDSYNDRVIVIDPQTHAIVWQYGHTGKSSNRAGYLHTPDSAVLVP